VLLSRAQLYSHLTFKASGLLQEVVLCPLTCFVSVEKAAYSPIILLVLSSHHSYSTETPGTLQSSIYTTASGMLSHYFPQALKTLVTLQSPHYPSAFFIFKKQHEESVHEHPMLTKTRHIQLLSYQGPQTRNRSAFRECWILNLSTH